MQTSLIVAIVLVVIAFTLISRGLRIVPQQHAWVVERLGRYSRTLEPGLNLLIPIVDKVAYKFDLRETPMDVQKQVCITKDNTQISIDGVLYLQITDPKAAAYGTSDPMSSVEQLAQTIMRSDVGKKQLDEVLSSRTELNVSIVSELDNAAVNWGVKVLRYEIRDINPPAEVIRAMELQITAERQKRALIAKSEGEKQQAVNVSEGERQQQINRAEGAKRAKILQAEGDAQAVTTVAEATARALATVGAGLQQSGAQDAMKMQVAQDFIAQWGGIAKESNVMIVPSDMGDLSKVVGTAFRIVDGIKPKPAT
ncbi:SPFH domain-containing protein [Oleiagrimonas sp.]|jgi:regulator of protease activity HflC (stomatin/prohibitin superfamily)|uniref:SPFH domain-containing protein n=1 Tax=Oleiagrimonas sp. TaxID=2010330 RepID=UPI0026156E37|nr:SPFH domain-containing protein [Oleiagrimonas sp.]MDA3913786.1 SPFH domain-containing protein [Oleiagrimonas sp.]